MRSRTVWRDQLTIPNALSVFRLTAAPFLVVLALADRRTEVVALFLAMTISDWIDGKIAILLDQRSAIGPRLDSVADLLMYSSLLAASVILDGPRLLDEWPWLAAPMAAYLAAGAASLAKFGRWPHHHTRLAKISWGLMLIGAVAFLAMGVRWPLRVALLGAALASVQSAFITRVLPQWQEDVPSVMAARRIRDARASLDTL